MSTVRTFGVEPDPAKRLRKKWGAEMRETRLLLGWTQEQVADEMTKAGYPVTSQAVSFWERGETAPRAHHQVGWCKVTGRQHRDVFTMNDEAA